MLTIKNIDRIKGHSTDNNWSVALIVVDTHCYSFYMEYTITLYNPMTFTPQHKVTQNVLVLERELDPIGLGYKLKVQGTGHFQYIHKSDLKDVLGLLKSMECLL